MRAARQVLGALGLSAGFALGRPSAPQCSASATPARFLAATDGDADAAAARWAATLAWRHEQRVDDLLHTPQPHFDVIKRHFPHAIVGRDRCGRPVIVERVGGARAIFKRLRAEGVLPADVARYQVFLHEWMWNELVAGEADYRAVQQPPHQQPSAAGRAVRVYDLAGLSARDATASKAREYFLLMNSVVGEHYPERVERAFVVSAPAWFAVIWDFAGPLIPKRTKAKLSVSSSAAPHELVETVGKEALPRCYGGVCDVVFGESEEERALCAFVAQLDN